MPTFCRHNRLVQNCPICSREEEVELRPIVSSGSAGGESRPRTPSRPASGPGRRRARPSSAAGVTVRRVRDSLDDGYRCGLVPGLKASGEARRLVEELGFAAWRLDALVQAPPGLYAEVAAPGDLEERAWLAFLIAYLCPADGEDSFASIGSVRTSWRSGELPQLEDVALGPRSAHDPDRGVATLAAYRAWAERAGSQAAALTGDAVWPPERRFARIYERLALPGLDRGARFDFLVTLGRLGVSQLRSTSLMLGGGDEVTVAAKRALGIGDPLLLERRATQLAQACQVPLEALDLAFFSWERGSRATMGMAPDANPDPDVLAAALGALELA